MNNSNIAIKKDFAELVAFLQENSNKKVKNILDEVIAMTAKQSGGGSIGSTVRKDESGKVVEIFCYYHKVWEKVDEVPYGAKSNSTSGLNTMCKQGVSNWTKQQRLAKQAKSELLDQVAQGLIAPEELNDKLAEIEAERNKILPYSHAVVVDEVEETIVE